MGYRFSGSMITVAIAAVGAAISVPVKRTSAQAPAASGMALKTPWGEPDLQGIVGAARPRVASAAFQKALSFGRS
jgi:hypothetical protein